MRFYYISIFSVMFLGVLYLLGTGLLAWIWYRLRKWKRAWVLMVPLFVLLYVGPIAEELWIAWNFGRLCSKDAGIFVYKTVQVDGFYDATMRSAYEAIQTGGYHFMEHRSRDETKVEHVEKIDGKWKVTILDHPTARYHYESPHQNTSMGYGVSKIERVVRDSQTGEVLARETKYVRDAPWFFIGLDRPVMLCPTPGEHSLEKFGSVYNLALKPLSAR